MAAFRIWPEAARERARTLLLAAILSTLISACAATPGIGPQPLVLMDEGEPEHAWRGIVHPADLERLERLDQAWTEALASARSAGFSRRVRAEGALLEPDAALPRPAPAPGVYRCRVIRFGAARPRGRAYSVTPSFCHVGADGPLLSLTRQTGPERPGGYLYDDADTRQVYIAAVARGRERVPPAYGEDPERNVVGVVERIGDFRYRLVLPWPAGARLEVYELVPAVG